MTRSFRLPLLAAAIAAAVPAIAQTPPPAMGAGPTPMHGPMRGGPVAGAPMPGGPMGGPGMPHHGMGGMDGMDPRAMFDSLSPEGRKIMIDAMASAGDRKSVHEQVRAARDHMLAVLDADRLDVGALKRAMDEEQASVNAQRDRMQQAMIGGFTRLSVADRKAFVAYARAMKNRMEARMDKWRALHKRGEHGDMPPPPPGM